MSLEDVDKIDLNALDECSSFFSSGSDWHGFYLLSSEKKRFSGTFQVDLEEGSAMGVHILTIESCEKISGKFYNADNPDPKKPAKGRLCMYKDETDAKEKLKELLITRSGSGT